MFKLHERRISGQGSTNFFTLTNRSKINYFQFKNNWIFLKSKIESAIFSKYSSPIYQLSDYPLCNLQLQDTVCLEDGSYYLNFNGCASCHSTSDVIDICNRRESSRGNEDIVIYERKLINFPLLSFFSIFYFFIFFNFNLFYTFFFYITFYLLSCFSLKFFLTVILQNQVLLFHFFLLFSHLKIVQ